MNHDCDPQDTISLRSLYIQPTLDDLLSSEGKVFEEAYLDDPLLTLRNIEHMVAQDIDNWVASVANVGEACVQLEILLDQYTSSMDRAHSLRHSIRTLTEIELWVAIDKLVTKEIPILVDYSPEIPLDLFNRVLLPNLVTIHRVCRLYQYLSDRHRRAFQGWSVISDEFTDDSFPVRYFDGSANFHHLKDRIDKNLLPSNPYHAKVVVFELQSPISFQIWRSITCSQSLRVFRYDYDCLLRSSGITVVLHQASEVKRTPRI
ncbi:hypothetical protein JVU11DRAFT_8587 [Chiua virens]|nr:hypothetical protein JVU11DRAFT_8587 [Chiua virens]